jgi:hypothetical protein
MASVNGEHAGAEPTALSPGRAECDSPFTLAIHTRTHPQHGLSLEELVQRRARPDEARRLLVRGHSRDATHGLRDGDAGGEAHVTDELVLA